MSESQLGRPGAKSAVNPVLYDICKFVRMPDASRVIEGEGGGIREAITALTSAGLRPPRFIDTGVQFTAIISRHTLISEEDLAWLTDITDEVDLTSEQRAILVSMRHGIVWNNSKVRHEFAPIDSIAARRMLQELVDAKLATPHGERGATTYSLARRLGRAKPPAIEVEEVLPSQPSLLAASSTSASESPAELNAHKPQTKTASTRHGPAVLATLDQPRTLTEILDRSGLTENRARYALTQLIRSGDVVMEGAQGVRTTRYRRSKEP